jgi:hypothetical protein
MNSYQLILNLYRELKLHYQLKLINNYDIEYRQQS